MFKLALLLLAFLPMAAVLSGCNDDDETPPVVSTPEQGGTDLVPEGEIETELVNGISRMKEYFAAHHRDRDWYNDIEDIDFEDRTAVVELASQPSVEDAREVCNAAAGFLFSPDQFELGIERVVVVDADERVVNAATNASAECLDVGTSAQDAELTPDAADGTTTPGSSGSAGSGAAEGGSGGGSAGTGED